MGSRRCSAALFTVAVVLGACDGHPLAPGKDAGAPTLGTGTAGTRGTAWTGAGGASGGGAGEGVAPRPPGTPLPIQGLEALGRVTAVLWNEQPDADLTNVASGVTTTADFEAAIRRVLADPRAATGVAAFYRWWLGLDRVYMSTRDPALFPEATTDVLSDMAAETAAFGVDTTLAMNGTFQTLMTASWSVINERLAPIYGVTGVTGYDLRRVPLPAGQRAGLLTQGSLQVIGSFATRNSPSHRGSEIARTFFCQPIPAAPPNVQGLDPVPPNETVRQALLGETANATCTACHAIIDPPGLVFEGFDAAGRARTTDNGLPIDTSAGIMQLSHGVEVVVSGPVDLASRMSTDSGVQGCFAQKWLSFALGRDVGPADQPSLKTIQAKFAASGNLQALIVDVLTSDTFLAAP
jgi:hypothetical protein